MPKFEECIDRLEKIVKELEKGEVPLEQSLMLFEEGMQLSSACRKELEQAEGKVVHLALKPKSECINSLCMLERAEIVCPPMSEQWMHDSLSFLVERGELTPPAVMQPVGA